MDGTSPADTSTAGRGPDACEDKEIVIICALQVEAEALVHVFETYGSCKFKQCGPRQQYLGTRIEGFEGRKYAVAVAIQPRSGGQEMHNLMERLGLDPQKVALLLTTGICAGVEYETDLGDVIVPDTVYHYDNRSRHNAGGKTLFDSHAVHINADFISWVLSNSVLPGMQIWTEYIGMEKPYSRRYVKEVMLSKLHEKQTQAAPEFDTSFGLLNRRNNTQAQTLLTEVAVELQSGKLLMDDNQTLTPEGAQLFKDQRTQAATERRPYPSVYSEKPKVRTGTLATGASVRRDFDKLIPVLRESAGERSTIAVDMESYDLLNASEQHRFLKVVIKAISDYGTEEKDDSFHVYAARASAAYALHVIKCFCIEEMR